MPRRVHNRTDLKYTIVRGRSYFTRAAYACVITQSTAYPDQRAIYHVRTFYGDNGTAVRAEARRYGSRVCRGLANVGGFRNQNVPSGFDTAGLPPRERDVVVRTTGEG